MPYLQTGEKFCPRRNGWEPIPSMHSRRSTHELCAIEGNLYSIGGNDGSSSLNSIEVGYLRYLHYLHCAYYLHYLNTSYYLRAEVWPRDQQVADGDGHGDAALLRGRGSGQLPQPGALPRHHGLDI